MPGVEMAFAWLGEMQQFILVTAIFIPKEMGRRLPECIFLSVFRIINLV